MMLNTETLDNLIVELEKSCGDYLEFDTTTNIGANSSIVSTTLRQYDDGSDGHFDGYWIYITEGVNANVERRVGLPGGTTYASSTGTMYVYGGALGAESAAVTIRLTKYKPSHYWTAITEATREVYPLLNKHVDDMSLISGNILPDGSFESWSSSSALNWITAGTTTLARTNTSSLIRGQLNSYSMKVTANTANAYASIDSSACPQLLDLQNRTVNFYCWAYAQTANDPTIEIYTVDSAGSTQTLASTTACASVRWTKLELENQSINDNLTYIQIRWKVATSTKYTYFDDAYLTGMRLDQYLLPDSLLNGSLEQVYLQDTGYSDERFYDLNPFIYEESGTLYKHSTINDGRYVYLKMLEKPISGYRLRLLGKTQLEAMTSLTDTCTIDDYRIPLLLSRAKMIFYEREASSLSVDSRDQMEYEYAKAQRDFSRLQISHGMSKLARKM